MTEQTATPAAQPEPMVPKPKVPAMVLEHLKAMARRLNPDNPGFRASEEVRAALESEGLRIYLNSWVRPLLEDMTAWAEGAEGATKAAHHMAYAFKSGYLR